MGYISWWQTRKDRIYFHWGTVKVFGLAFYVLCSFLYPREYFIDLGIAGVTRRTGSVHQTPAPLLLHPLKNWSIRPWYLDGGTFWVLHFSSSWFFFTLLIYWRFIIFLELSCRMKGRRSRYFISEFCGVRAVLIDLAYCNLWFFPKLKEYLRERHYPDLRSVSHAPRSPSTSWCQRSLSDVRVFRDVSCSNAIVTNSTL